MSAPALITDPGAIDTVWVAAVLDAAGHHGEVRAVSTTPVGTGLMGRSYRVTLDADGSGPPTVVVKLPSADAPTRELGAGAYQKEIGFYRDLAHRVRASVPGCLHADISESGQEFVLVLEDIHDATQGDQIQGCSATEAGDAVRNLAHLHASTWSDASIAILPWCARTRSQALGAILPLAFDAFRHRFAGPVADSTWPILARFVDGIDRWRELEPPTRAAVHGDYRLDNLLFGGLDRPVTAVDWQTIDFANPGRDVAYFLGNSLTIDDRRTHEEELIEVYVDTLQSSGVEEYDLDQCLADARYGTFQGPLVTILGAFVAGRSARSEEMFAVMADRAAAQIADHGALDLLS